MKYTRYNAKPKKKQGSNLLFYFALTLLLALVLGTVVQKYLMQDGGAIWFKNQGQQNSGQPTKPSGDNGGENQNGGDGDATTATGENQESKDENGEVIKDNYNFYLLQCGVFKVQENANKLLDTLKLYGRPFTEVEGELTKVFFGVYTDETIGAAMELLKSKGIDVSKVTITVPVEDLSSGQLCKISENMIEIMSKTYEPGVKSINTGDIKNWIGQLEIIETSMKQHVAVEEMKTYVKGLPEEVDKSSIQDGMQLIYNKIKAYK